MSANLPLGVVTTARVQSKVNLGLGVFPPDKVYAVPSDDGHVIVDGIRCKIVKKSDAIPENKVYIGGRLYDTVIIGNRKWLAEPLQYKTTDSASKEGSEDFGMYYNTTNDLNELLEIIPDGWRLPVMGGDNSDFTGIYENGAYAVQSTDYPTIFPNATNESGFDARPSGARRLSNGTFPAVNMTKCLILTSDRTTTVIVEPSRITSYNFGTNALLYGFPIRLVSDI